jgi:hypothetical protein
MSTLSPLRSPGFDEHRAEMRRQHQRDMEATEQQRMRNERDLALRRGDLRRQEQALAEREEQLRADRAALQADLDAANTARAESMLTDDGPVLITMLAIPQSNPATTATAEAIIRAAAKARGTAPPDPLPSDPTARAVILSGRRARGEPIAESDARWLDAYCARLDHARR